MENEVWKPVPGFLNIYVVSNLGRVRNVCPPRGNGLLFGEIDRYGYRAVNLSGQGKKVKRRVHRLVCEAFHGPPPDGHEACHLDGNQRNNHADNLAWGTRAENMRHAVEHGTHRAPPRPPRDAMRRGAANPSAKLTETVVAAARERHAAGESGAKLAKEFGVTQANMSRALRGSTWAHVANGDLPKGGKP